MTPELKKPHQKRGAYHRADCVFIGAWIPRAWAEALDQAVSKNDSDRSKEIRRAIELQISQEAAA